MAAHDVEPALLGALTQLMARWSSPTTQGQIASEAGSRISTADIPAVYTLGMRGATRPSVLADELHLSRPTMSKQITRLSDEGYIERAVDPSDGRASLVVLSAAGAATYNALVEQGLEMMRAAIHGWPEDDRHEFAALLTRFVAALGVDLISQKNTHEWSTP